MTDSNHNQTSQTSQDGITISREEAEETIAAMCSLIDEEGYHWTDVINDFFPEQVSWVENGPGFRMPFDDFLTTTCLDFGVDINK